eukprot:11534305-Alexandrium_andersonii.AAC.1
MDLSGPGREHGGQLRRHACGGPRHPRIGRPARVEGAVARDSVSRRPLTPCLAEQNAVVTFSK